MAFRPPRCPYSACPAARAGAAFAFHRKGFFPRRLDERRVQRFQCLVCRRKFSTQTFRLDYRLQKPWLDLAIFRGLVAKKTHRQAARERGLSRSTIRQRLLLFGNQCRRFHRWRLARACKRAPLAGVFLLDELETFEQNRRLRPLTVPVLIERTSRYVLASEVGTLPARGRLSEAHEKRREALEELEGRRKNQSRAATGACWKVLERATRGSEKVEVRTDRKTSYVGGLRRALGKRAEHRRTSSRELRDTRNPLFAINHTLAMLRDGCSRLVRRSWAHAKRARFLWQHLWIWIAYRNYVRPWKASETATSSAMEIGVETRMWKAKEILRWRLEVLLPLPAQVARVQ